MKNKEVFKVDKNPTRNGWSTRKSTWFEGQYDRRKRKDHKSPEEDRNDMCRKSNSGTNNKQISTRNTRKQRKIVKPT